MWKQQRLHDWLIDSTLVNADQLSVYSEQGEIEWIFCPNDQSYRLFYQSNILIREYSNKPHLLFLCLTAFLDAIDPTRPHKPLWETSVLNNKVVDIEIRLKFEENYHYRLAEVDAVTGELEPADAMLNNQPVVLIPEAQPELGWLKRFALIMPSQYTL